MASYNDPYASGSAITMADRYFEHNFPKKAPSDQTLLHEHVETVKKLANTEAEKLQRQLTQVVEERMNDKRSFDSSIYTGLCGILYSLYFRYRQTGDTELGSFCAHGINQCISESERHKKRISFLTGPVGPYALGAALYHALGYKEHRDTCVEGVRKLIATAQDPHEYDELLFGRAGYLHAQRFINEQCGAEIIPTNEIQMVAKAIISSGKRLGNEECPLMWEWHDKKYLGAAHGVAGIVHELLCVTNLLHEDEAKLVRKTIDHCLKYFRFNSGNFRSSIDSSKDKLVHWCHGAPGWCMTLAKAFKVFGKQRYIQGAVDAAEVVWHRGLLRRVGVCHGITGNTYVHISMYRLFRHIEESMQVESELNSDDYIHRGMMFAEFLFKHYRKYIKEGHIHGGESPHSLFEGTSCTAIMCSRALRIENFISSCRRWRGNASRL
eukprot:gb/GECG01007749.1/.p1 GENE.gb/GECG01007749.1/~~gb/GECG01007749.1/.p1  ORF type:complete len:438 (+),score=36.37 gb/GECG01007749.1/:1-1314(+)